MIRLEMETPVLSQAPLPPQPAQPYHPSWRHRTMLRLIGLYPPFLGAGIRVRRLRGGDPEVPDLPPDVAAFRVRMPLTIFNRNYFGTQFGGSLYMMCDPFYLLLLLEALGPGYIVWDKAATVHFRRPGLGTVSAIFQVPRERVEEIRAEVERVGKAEPLFTARVTDERGEVVAEVEKLLHVRRKER